MPRVLIIAYGNPLRSDDGIAWRAADCLRDRFPGNEIEIVTLHQLGPEFAESISQCERVIFIDAASDGPAGEVQIQELSVQRAAAPARFFHALSAVDVLVLASQLYGAHPRAFSATVVGQNFEHGEGLSPVVEAALPKLVSAIEKLISANASPSSGVAESLPES